MTSSYHEAPYIVSSQQMSAILKKNLGFIYLFLERGEGRGREGEKHQCVVASCAPPTGHLACNPDICPDWKSNLQAFGSKVRTQSTERYQPGQMAATFIGLSSLVFSLDGLVHVGGYMLEYFLNGGCEVRLPGFISQFCVVLRLSAPYFPYL